MTEISADLKPRARPPEAPFPPLEDSALRVIVPTKRRLKLRRLARDQAFVRVLAGRDFKLKYQQSVLGPLWLVIQPLALLLAFLVAFRGRWIRPYLLRAIHRVRARRALRMVLLSVGYDHRHRRDDHQTRTSFATHRLLAQHSPSRRPSRRCRHSGSCPRPRSWAPLSPGHLSPRVLLLPVGLLWLLVLTVGVIAISSALAVRYRDVVSALPLVLQVGVFLAPVGYSLAGLSPTVSRHCRMQSADRTDRADAVDGACRLPPQRGLDPDRGGHDRSGHDHRLAHLLPPRDDNGRRDLSEPTQSVWPRRCLAPPLFFTRRASEADPRTAFARRARRRTGERPATSAAIADQTHVRPTRPAQLPPHRAEVRPRLGHLPGSVGVSRAENNPSRRSRFCAPPGSVGSQTACLRGRTANAACRPAMRASSSLTERPG